MPNMVKIRPVKSFKANGPAETEQFALAKTIGEIEVSVATAHEAVKNSKGLYEIVPEHEPQDGLPAVDWHHNKSNHDLLAMLASYNIKTEKQMRRSDIIALLEKKFDEVSVSDD